MNHGWSDLPLELLRTIEQEVQIYTDKLRFSYVCKSWKSVVEVSNSLPVLVVPTHNSKNGFDTISFGVHSLQTKKVYDIDLGFDLEGAKDKMFVGSSYGWLITVDRKSPAIILINLGTTTQIQLPPRYKFPDVTRYRPNKIDNEYLVWDERSQISTAQCSSYVHHYWLRKVVLSSSPTSNNYTAACIYGYLKRLAVCRRGDRKWVSIHGTTRYEDIIFYKDHLYAASSEMHLAIFKVGCTSQPRFIEIIEFPEELYTYKVSHLVQHSDQILLFFRLTKWNQEKQLCITQSFKVFKFNRSEKAFMELPDIGSGLLFLGWNDSFFIPSNHLPVECEGNKIYFSEYHLNQYGFGIEGFKEPNDIGVYNLITKKICGIEDFDCDELVWPPPIWITLRNKIISS